MHAVNPDSDGETLLYIDRHFLHEVTSPQAFEGIEKKASIPGDSIAMLPPLITMFQLKEAK